MQYTTLGPTGLVVSRLCLGTMTFGSGDFNGLKFTVDQQLAEEMIAMAKAAGVNFLDTADMYCNGMSEEIIGRALADSRPDWIIATKCGFRGGQQAFNAGINYKHIVEACEASLNRLNTDYIDVYILHTDDPVTPLPETLKAVDNLVERGLIRYGAFSNWHTWKAATAVQMQKQHNYLPFAAGQMYYSLLNREIEHEFVPFLQATGTGLMVWSPLTGGFLTGKYSRENPAPENGRLNDFDFLKFDREFGYAVVDTVKAIAAKHGATPAQVSLAWLLGKPYVSTVIVGASKLHHLEDNLKAAQVELTEADRQTLDEISRPNFFYPSVFYQMADPVLSSAKPA